MVMTAGRPAGLDSTRMSRDYDHIFFSVNV